MEKINLELKHYCDDFNPIRVLLKKSGAKNLGVAHQKDYFLNLPPDNSLIEPRLKFRVENNKQTLIFYKRGDFQAKTGNPASILLYEVQDDKLLDFLREVLGVRAIVKKTRERWRKDNAVFNLDDVYGVGKVFEIEIETTPENKEEDEVLFKKYEKEFSKYLGEVIKGSNVDLVK